MKIFRTIVVFLALISLIPAFAPGDNKSEEINKADEQASCDDYKFINLGLFPPVAIHPDKDTCVKFNLMLFYSHVYSVRGVDISAGVSVIEGNLRGAQVDGLAAVTGGNVYGMQIAGLVNVAGENVKGIQAAGLVNISGEEMRGIQAAGIANVTDRLYGIQAALVNMSGSMNGIQAGIWNMTGEFSGMQAGVANMAGDFRGFQAGTVNFSGSVLGFQAGIVNFSGDVYGTQAGVVNFAGNVEGTQIGLVNVAGKIDGIPIGLVNIAENGSRQVVLWAGNFTPVNVGIKFNVNNIYSIISAGYSNRYADIDDSLVWGGYYGYHFDLAPLYIETDIGYTLFDNESYFERGGSLDQHMIGARVTLGVDIAEGFSVFAGGGLGYYWDHCDFSDSGELKGQFFGGVQIFRF